VFLHVFDGGNSDNLGLHWNGRAIAETLVIAGYLHAESGDDAALSADERLRHAMLTSSLCGDLMLPIGLLIWADLAYEGVDLEKVALRTLERLHKHLDALNRTLGEWQWLERARERPVMVADCLLWEELNVAQHVFGAHLALETRESLAMFYQAHPARATFEKLLAEHPCPITARPGEAQTIARLHEILAANA
jgi:glutathione S-transferase